MESPGPGGADCADAAGTAAVTSIGVSIHRQPLAWVERCIQSARQQSDPAVEILVRGDGREAFLPEVWAWLQELRARDPRLVLLEGSERLGTFGSYRAVFAAARGRYLCQLDADDWLEGDAVSRCRQAIEAKPHCPFVYTDCHEVDAREERLGLGQRSRVPYSPLVELVQFIPFHLRFIRRGAYVQAGGYGTDFLYSGDYDLALRLAELGPPHHLPLPLYNYRIHGDNTSRLQRQQTILEAHRAASDALRRRGLAASLQLDLDMERCQVSLRPRQETGEPTTTAFRGPYLVTGMHRSGTSLLARLLVNLGFDLGSDLVAADAGNPDGYFEDRAFLDLQRRLLARRVAGRHGHPDWGWSLPQAADAAANGAGAQAEAADQAFREEAEALLRAGAARPQGRWGWKDPRTTLLLPFWQELAPGFRLIAVYRAPWEVIDALQRVRPPLFLRHPDWALPIWQQHNEALLDFATRHPDRCLLVSSAALRQRPQALAEVLRRRWGPRCCGDASRPEDSFIRSGRMAGVAADDPLVALFLACSPAAAAVYRDLERIADLPSGMPLPVEVAAAPTPRLQPESPRLSVVLPTFNQGDLLLEAVASVERSARGIAGIELLIVDDGCSDTRSLEVLQGLEDLGYRVLRQPNQGLAAARNNGIAATRGAIVLPLDDDNRLLPTYLQRGLPLMEADEGVDVVYGDRLDFGLRQARVVIGEPSLTAMLQQNHIDACALIRRSFWQRCGGYDPSLPALEDWDLWLKGMRQGMHAVYLAEPCFEYRTRPDSMLRTVLQQPERYQELVELLSRRHGVRLGLTA